MFHLVLMYNKDIYRKIYIFLALSFKVVGSKRSIPLSKKKVLYLRNLINPLWFSNKLIHPTILQSLIFSKFNVFIFEARILGIFNGVNISHKPMF